jgi:3-dehydroquinate dehydratase-2
MNKIIILNGPNLNLLGEREKNQYGNFTLKDIEKNCKQFSSENSIDLSLFQSNIEGELIEKIQNSRDKQQGLFKNIKKTYY